MGIRLYLTFYNCVTASENAYATSSFGYSRDKFIHQSNYCWLPLMIIFRSDHITKQSQKEFYTVRWRFYNNREETKTLEPPERKIEIQSLKQDLRCALDLV